MVIPSKFKTYPLHHEYQIVCDVTGYQFFQIKRILVTLNPVKFLQKKKTYSSLVNIILNLCISTFQMK